MAFHVGFHVGSPPHCDFVYRFRVFDWIEMKVILAFDGSLWHLEQKTESGEKSTMKRKLLFTRRQSRLTSRRPYANLVGAHVLTYYYLGKIIPHYYLDSACAFCSKLTRVHFFLSLTQEVSIKQGRSCSREKRTLYAVRHGLTCYLFRLAGCMLGSLFSLARSSWFERENPLRC